MRITKTLKTAFENIFANSARSMLTSLGIIIGTATIIVVVAVGLGAQDAIARQYSNLSVTSIFISTGPTVTSTRLKTKDASAILESCPSVETVSPQLIGKLAVNQGVASSQETIVGTTPPYAKTAKIELARGRFLTDQEVKGNQRVAVLGPTVVEDLGGDVPVGGYVKIKGRKFEIVGITKSKGGSFGPVNIDESVFIPDTVAQKQILGADGRVSLNANAKSVDMVQKAMEEITTALRTEHHLPASAPDDFKVNDMGTNLLSAQQSSRTMAILLTSVAAIVLVVSGIGIMNIMLVTVTERTKEIGIRKAVGATRTSISQQFLAEAMLISLFGGVIGAIAGIVVVPLANSLGIDAIQSAWGIGLALTFSIVFGVFFGYYPAQKAARLDPIVALNYE